ncbi:hypothetical protein ACFE04_030086 [Oxalis oulophora]
MTLADIVQPKRNYHEDQMIMGILWKRWVLVHKDASVYCRILSGGQNAEKVLCVPNMSGFCISAADKVNTALTTQSCVLDTGGFGVSPHSVSTPRQLADRANKGSQFKPPPQTNNSIKASYVTSLSSLCLCFIMCAISVTLSYGDKLCLQIQQFDSIHLHYCCCLLRSDGVCKIPDKAALPKKWKYTKIIDCVETVVREKGLAALLKGIQPRVLWIGIGGSIFFGVLERTKRGATTHHTFNAVNLQKIYFPSDDMYLSRFFRSLKRSLAQMYRQNVQQQVMFKQRVECEEKRLHPTLCFKGRPLPDFCKERGSPNNYMKKTLNPIHAKKIVHEEKLKKYFR